MFSRSIVIIAVIGISTNWKLQQRECKISLVVFNTLSLTKKTTFLTGFVTPSKGEKRRRKGEQEQEQQGKEEAERKFIYRERSRKRKDVRNKKKKVQGEEEKEEKKKIVCLVGFLTSSSTIGYTADGPQDRASDNFTCCDT